MSKSGPARRQELVFHRPVPARQDRQAVQRVMAQSLIAWHQTRRLDGGGGLNHSRASAIDWYQMGAYSKAPHRSYRQLDQEPLQLNVKVKNG